MGTLLQFPKIHREEMLRQKQHEELIQSFTEEAKRLGLTLEQIRDMAPLPRSCFPVTQASLLLAEKRGLLPRPIIFNGKFCYSVWQMIEKALSKWIPFEFVESHAQAKLVALAVVGYRDGHSLPLIYTCYVSREIRRKYHPALTGTAMPFVVMKATIRRILNETGRLPTEDELRKVFPDVGDELRAFALESVTRVRA